MAKKSTTENTTIRDFIYVDADRIYSLYSQLNKGVAENIVESTLYGIEREKTQKGSLLQGSQSESRLTETKHSSESRVLHDYIYVELESLLNDLLATPQNITPENYQNELSNIFFLKVKGKAEITDYSRIKELLNNLNSLLEGMHYIEFAQLLGGNPQYNKAIFSKSNVPDKKKHLELLKQFDNPKEMALLAGKLQDEKTLKYVESIFNLFYTNEIEITIIPDNIKGIVFRGLTDKQWLRGKPESLRHLYGGYSEEQWTMVGQITHIPGSINEIVPNLMSANINSQQNTKDLEEELNDATSSEAETTSFRGGMNEMLSQIRLLEKFMMVNSQRVEVVVAPLAIYREMLLPVTSGK